MQLERSDGPDDSDMGLIESADEDAVDSYSSRAGDGLGISFKLASSIKLPVQPLLPATEVLALTGFSLFSPDEGLSEVVTLKFMRVGYGVDDSSS